MGRAGKDPIGLAHEPALDASSGRGQNASLGQERVVHELGREAALQIGQQRQSEAPAGPRADQNTLVQVRVQQVRLETLRGTRDRAAEHGVE